jgi:broad specificity phosphatase PhoE
MDRVITRARAVGGDVALFAHGHVLRVLGARWIGLPSSGGEHFLLDTGTLCVLSYYRDVPAVRIWNGPLIERGRGARHTRKREERLPNAVKPGRPSSCGDSMQFWDQ